MKQTTSFSSSTKGSASLKLLSETEKLQLMQLQKTRERIAKELNKYPGVDTVGFDDDDDEYGFSGNRTSSAYGKSSRSIRGASSMGSRGRSRSPSRPGSRPGSRPSTHHDYFETIKAGIDMMPVMATSGNAAMGGNDKGKIKLPIFKLPSIDTSRLKSRDQNRNLEKALQQGETFEQRFIPYRDLASYRKALVLMIKSFRPRDAQYIQQYLGMTAADIADLESELRKKSDGNTTKTPRPQRVTPKTMKSPIGREQSAFFPDNNSASSGLNSEAKEGILDTLFREDPNMSVFSLAKDVVTEEKRERDSTAVGDNNKEAVQYNKALRNITSKMDMSALGLSDSMTEYLTMGSSSASVHTIGTEGFQKLKNNVSTALGGFVTAGVAHHTQTVAAVAAIEPSATMRKMAAMPALYSGHASTDSLAATYGRKNKVKSGKAGSNAKRHNASTVRLQPLLSRSDSLQNMRVSAATSGGKANLALNPNASASDLTQALMASLRTMQMHSNMIKTSISSAQSVINISDPKAKGLIFSVAAETMFRAMQPFLIYEIRRGFTAWMFVVRQERRQEKAGVFIHLLTLRNCLLALNSLVTRCLQRNMRRWKDYTVAEVKRLQKEKKLKAVLKLQAAFRSRLAKKKVEILRQRRKYQKLYDSTIKIQALIRGKLQRWRFLRETRDKLRNNAVTKIQSLMRGYLARKRVYLMRLRKNKALAATTIQKIVRGRLATKRVAIMLRNKRHGVAATKMQGFIRGYLARKHMARILIEMAHFKYAVKIQALVRGALGRIHLSKKIAAMQEYRAHRNKAATMIQSTYRGYRCNVLYKMMMHKMNKVKKEQNRAATQIGRIVRGFVARAYLRDLKVEQRERWIADARVYKETWADDSESWFYYNEETGEALWEPSALGYTKSDGLLVLANGEIIEDPAKASQSQKRVDENGDPIESDEEEEEVKELVPDKKKNTRLCSECSSRVAIRACVECGDKFCTKCYKHLHSTGTRRSHTYKAVGPLDCTECELRLAERWCVSCDENFCDGCWRKVHSKGKRAFHPYSEISGEGRIDPRIFTMDGDQLSDYDSSYAQQRVDVNSYNAKQQGRQQQYAAEAGSYASADESTVAMYDANGGYDYISSGTGAAVAWEQYYDDNGYLYYYDPATGASQYDAPEGY